jgi:hypothetical protein
VAVLVVAAVVIGVGGAAAASEWAIPPGHEQLFAEMLGKDLKLAGECQWDGASIEDSTLTATFACAAGSRNIELRHPSDATPDAALTKSFAVVPLDGAPRDLVDAVAERVRAREAGWRWASIGDPTGKQVTAPHAAAPKSEALVWWSRTLEQALLVAWGALAVWIAAFGAMLAWRRRARLLSRDAIVCAALIAAALALRLVVPWGPLDFAEGERAAWAWSATPSTRVGFESMAVLHRVLRELGAGPDTLLRWLGPLAGAAGVGATYLLARAAGLHRPAALFAGLLVALWPAHLRYSATAGSAVPAATLWTAALAAAASRTIPPRWKAPLIAALALLAAHARPELGAALPAALPLLVTRRVRGSGRWVAIAAVLGAAATFWITPREALPSSPLAGEFLGWLPLDVSVGPAYWVLLGTVGLAIGRGSLQLRAGLLGTCAALVAAYALHASEANPLFGQWRLYTTLVPLWALGAAMLVSRAPRVGRDVRTAIALAAIALLGAAPQARLWFRSIDAQAEFAFARETASRVRAARPGLVVLVPGRDEQYTASVETIPLMGIAAGTARVDWPLQSEVPLPDLPRWILPSGALENEWTQEVDWSRTAIYLGVYRPAHLLDRIGKRFSLTPIEERDLTAAPATRALETQCPVQTRLLGANLEDCTLRVGWYALAPIERRPAP